MVGIVILNWNGLDDTLRCLRSLQETKSATIPTQTIVVDNGSTIDPGDEIKRNFPDVDYVRLDKNVGYAAGCNVGAKRALSRNADFILFLNNDTVVEPNLFEPLLAGFSQDPSIGIASPLSCTMANPRRIDFGGGRISFPLGRFSHRHDLTNATTPFEADYVSGCSLMISKTAIKRIGLFDEKLFAYFEDVDLCLRAQQSGFKTVCAPVISIKHTGSATTRRNLNQGTTSPLKHYLVVRNRSVIINRYASRTAKCFHALVINPLRICFYVCAFVSRGRWTKLRWFLRGVRDGCRGKLEMPTELVS